MRRFGSVLQFIAATCAMAMLLGVQFFHSPLHHVACTHPLQAAGAQCGLSLSQCELPLPTPCAHGHWHCHGTTAPHSHTAGQHPVSGDTPPCEHDANCHLCDLALTPAAVAEFAMVEAGLELIETLTVTPQPVYVAAISWTSSARGPPLA